MPFAVKLSESTAARRRIPVYLVDVTDRITPETGILAPTIEISKNGGGQGAGAGNWGEVGDGLYYYEFTTGEIDTLGGGHTIRIVKAGVTAEFVDSIVVTAYDPYSSTNLGLSYLSGSVALDSTVSKEATLNTKIPTALSFTGANVNAESKVTAAPTDMALNSTVAKDATVSKAAGGKGTDDIHDTMATEANVNAKIPTALSFTGANVNAESKVTAAPTDMALNSTVAKEATLNTKIPTALSFTGANVNSESKITASPTDMALNSTVAKEATINTKIPTALGFTGSNVNAESKVTAAPTDMALNSTVAKSAGSKGTDEIHDDVAGITGFALDSTVAKEATLNTKIPTALGFTGANVNSESKVTAPPTDMALNSTVAKAAGTKGTDAIYDDTILHPTLGEIEGSTVLAKQAELLRALGLMQENQYIDTIFYTSGKVTSMRLRTYDTKANVGTGTGVIATYTITANYTGDVLNWFKAVKE